MNAISLLSSDGYIIVNKALIKEIGLTEAVMLGELCSEYDYFDSKGTLVNGWFYSTLEEMESNTTFTRFQQKRLLDKLVKLGYISVEVKGLPAKRLIKINESKIGVEYEHYSI